MGAQADHFADTCRLRTSSRWGPLRAGIASHGRPAEILTDNGSQYMTWRGKSALLGELEKVGIRQIVSRPRHPRTLGKIDRFWGSLWRERVETAVFMDLGDARTRIGHFIDHYNFQRPHQGLDGGDPLPAQSSGCQQPAVVFSESAATVTWNESFD